MSKQPPQIEWDILDERAQSLEPLAEPLLQAAIPPATPGIIRRNLHLHLAGSLAALLLFSSGIWLWQQAQAGLNHVQAELQSQTEIELWAATQVDSALTNQLDPQAGKWNSQFRREDEILKSVQGDDPDSHLQVDLRLLELDDEWAKAQITTQEARSGATFRQTRFFRHTAQGWLRTAPTVETWGIPNSLETSYFVFSFRQHDAEVVAEVAPLLDALFVNLRLEFGLPPATSGTKPIITISPTETPEVSMRTNTPGRYAVPSPDLYLAPMSVSNSQLLLQSLALPMIRDLAKEAGGTDALTRMRPYVADALALWALWEADLPLSVWRQEIVQWRLGSEDGDIHRKIARFPDHYEEICAMYQVWLSSPAILSIPLTCSKDEQSALVVTMPNTPPIVSVTSRARLEELLFNFYWPLVDSPSRGRWSADPGDTVILTTFFEYLVSSYGRDKLPLFLAALRKSKDWETLCRTFFAQSTAEFNTRWQRYLITHYGVAGATE